MAHNDQDCGPDRPARCPIPRPAFTPDDVALRHLLGRWLPGATLTLIPTTSGGSTPVWRVDATWPDERTDTFYLRLGEEPGERRDGEVRVHQLLRAQGLRVPEVAAWEGSPPELDRAATLTRTIPGNALQEFAPTESAEVIVAIAEEAGRDLARIGDIPVEGFGWIGMPDAATGTLRAEHQTRGSWLAEYDRALDDIVHLGLVSPGAIPALREAFAAWRDRTPEATASATLAHGDFDATHIFGARDVGGTDPDEVMYTYTGIIDFGEARGADRFYDLGHALLHDGEDATPPIFPTLLRGYCTQRALDRDAVLAIQAQAIAIGVRQLAIAHRRQSPYAAVLASRIVHLVAARLADDGTVIHS